MIDHGERRLWFEGGVSSPLVLFIFASLFLKRPSRQADRQAGKLES